MDVDSASSSPSSRLSVVCSASAEYSSNSSEGSSPTSRRNSMNENVVKDEQYWERRRRNNDASRRSREKRRLNDLAMEERILQLSAENERLKSQLESRLNVDSSGEPSSSVIISDVSKNAFQLSQNPVASMLSVPLLQNAPVPSHPNLAMLQLCQLHSVAAAPPIRSPSRFPTTDVDPNLVANNHQQTSFISSTSAFQPFRSTATSVIMRAESSRQSPDSSTNEPQQSQAINVIQRVGSPVQQLDLQPAQQQQQQQQPQQGPSLLSALLAQRRPSPTVQQSRTEHISGLNSPPRRHTSSKSDCESVSSSASLSPSHSSEDHGNYSNKSPQYVDRRRRNNEAAKRCRANRRAVFEYRSRRVQLLEGENEELRSQIESLKAEIAQFKTILAQRAASSNISSSIPTSSSS